MTTETGKLLVFLEYKGVRIFPPYVFEGYECKVNDYYRTDGVIDPSGSNHDAKIATSTTPDDKTQFNVRDLPIPDGVNRSDHEAIIRHAIDSGIITQEV